jgi:hypothetical protein
LKITHNIIDNFFTFAPKMPSRGVRLRTEITPLAPDAGNAAVGMIGKLPFQMPFDAKHCQKNEQSKIKNQK